MTQELASPQTLYDLAEAYDIAFEFRDLGEECDQLDSLCHRYRGGTPRSFLDVACGSGYHCIEYAKRGIRSVGLDLSAAMLEYARRKSERQGAEVEFIQADMRDFVLAEPVDLAFCAMSTFHHLLTTDDIIRHLRAVARNLTERGLYIIEAEHPRDAFGISQTLKHEWESERDGMLVKSSWGLPTDHFDPITQVVDTTVRLQVHSPNTDSPRTHEFVTLLRRLTYQELTLLIEASGVFDAVDWLGRLTPACPLSTEPESIRMVPVLRNRDA